MSKDINWGATLEGLGIPYRFLTGKHTPCMFCGGKDRARFSDYKGEGYYWCNQCCDPAINGWGVVMKYFSLTFEEALEKVNGKRIISPVNNGARQQKKFDYARSKMISHYRSLVGGRNTPAHKYLNSRGIPFPDPFRVALDPEVWGAKEEVLGCFWLPEFQDGYGAMVWKAIDPIRGSIGQLHYTTLTNDGQKAPVNQVKKYSGAMYEMNKESYRVAPLIKGDPDVSIIAEGIETALSAAAIYKKLDPNAPIPTVYASMDAGMLAKFRPMGIIPDSKLWYICGDNDESGAGQKAGSQCAINIGMSSGDYTKSKLVLPPNCGEDWNDILISGDESKFINLVRPVI